LQMYVLCSHAGIAQVAKKSINILCFWSKYCMTCSKNQWAFFGLNVSVITLNEKLVHIVKLHEDIAS
jgi:hypothetical protein